MVFGWFSGFLVVIGFGCLDWLCLVFSGFWFMVLDRVIICVGFEWWCWVVAVFVAVALVICLFDVVFVDCRCSRSVG